MRATVVIDNNSPAEYSAEWGLCIYIEYKDQNILLDTGASDLFLENGEKLGLDFSKVDLGVLSHGHSDHGNGLEAFFKANDHARFYIQKNIMENYYFRKLFIKKYIGITKGVMAQYEKRISHVSGDTELSEGVFLVSHKTENLKELGRRDSMYSKIDGQWIPDDFAHEQSLVFDTEKGLVIFNSCCHGGAAHIINEIAKTFPDKKVYGLIGGFHLYNKKAHEIRELAEKIKETGIEYVCTGHCTKDRAYKILKKTLGSTLHHLEVGMVMEF